jgi:hypothetical protein
MLRTILDFLQDVLITGAVCFSSLIVVSQVCALLKNKWEQDRALMLLQYEADERMERAYDDVDDDRWHKLHEYLAENRREEGAE